MNRRSFLQVSAGSAITLPEFQPRSTLRVAEHPIRRAKFPVIDIHTHLFSLGRSLDPASADAAGLLRQIAMWMDECNLQTLINLTGGTSATIPAIRKAFAPFSPKFLTAAEPTWARANASGYSRWQADELTACKGQGAIGLKILKTLGLYLRDGQGRLVTVDDPRFDPMWEVAGSVGLPVLIHTSDPAAFFQPIDRFNERWEELGNHPDWSFYGKDYPTRRELHEARNRVIARHPRTTFIGLHVANNSEDLGQVSEWLERFPNLHVEIGARLGELGRQPRTSRKFFERYQDRILFGTDATPRGEAFPQQDLKPAMFRCYFRFLETEDEYFDYSPAAVPPQGRWRIYGIGLPDAILRKVYRENAARMFRLTA